jgi:hypothetical protein
VIAVGVGKLLQIGGWLMSMDVAARLGSIVGSGMDRLVAPRWFSFPQPTEKLA